MAEPDAIRWLHLTDAQVMDLRVAVGAVLRNHPLVVAAYHYGSSARSLPARDIDIGLVVDHHARHSVDADTIAADIAAKCGRPIDELDVRIVNDADSVFLGNLLREGKLCYQRDLDSRAAFEVQAMNAWLDYQPVWDRLRRRMLETWSRG